MKESCFKGMTRALALTIVALLVFSGAPALLGVEPAITNAAAATEDVVQIGWLNFEVQNWNPLCIEMVEDYVVCYLLYSGLWFYDENWGGPVNDLATGYYQVINKDGTMDTFVNITDDAYFRNMANPYDKSYQLTAYDVVWTFETIQANPGKTFDWYLLDCTEFEAMSDFQVRIQTSFQKATLIDDLSMIPILCEDYWVANFKTNPTKAIKPEQSFGTGPFMYNSSLSKTWYRFDKAPNYFGDVVYPGVRDINFDGLVYNVYTDSNALVLGMNNGDLDAVTLTGDITNFKNELGKDAGVNIIKYAVQEPGICDIAINAIPLSFRTKTYGNGNPILLDPAVREAIMMTLNKSAIVNDYLQGLAIQADSVVQPGYWHYTPKNQTPFDPEGAKELLIANGYELVNGYFQVTADTYAYKECGVPVGTSLTGIRCQAPDTDPTYYDIAVAWSDWAKQAGIGLTASQESEGYMTTTSWYQANYDIWVWHWGWGPEPLGGALSCWLTSEIVEGGDNCQMPMGPWWYGPDNYTDAPKEWDLTGPYSAFDQNFSKASTTLNPAERKVYVDLLQQMVYDSHCENPPYYDLGLYGITDARFTGWGNWSLHNGRPMTSDLLWTWFDLVPASNKPPVFNTELLSLYEPLVGETVTFSVTVSDPDNDPIQVNWSAGDGIGRYTQNLTGTTSNPTTITWNYVYTAPTTEPLEARVELWDHQLNHEIASTAQVNVYTTFDNSPNIKSLAADPAPPAYIGQSVSWTLVANDTETGDVSGEFLRVTWDWDDGTMDVIDATPASAGADVTVEVSHTWEYSDVFNVTVYVFDMTYDNVWHNVSAWRLYEILGNTAPTNPSISAISGLPDVPVPCVARSTTLDPDVLTFWWDWGNGTFTKDVKDMTSITPGISTTATSTVYHTWTAEGNYRVTVYVDDGQGHNVSSSTVAAIWEGPVAPTALGLVQSPDPGVAGAEVTLNLSAADLNEDALLFYLEFGDGNATTATTPGGTYELQYVEVTHTYEAAGTYTATLYVNDSLANVSETFSVEIISNKAPSISLSSSYVAAFNALFSVSPISVSDPDGDAVTVWYNWGDGTPVTKGGNAPTYTGTHTYAVGGTVTLTAYADDGMGHNTTATASVNIQDTNTKPTGSVVLSPSKPKYTVGETITFSVTCNDNEGDTVTVNISFGDGTYGTQTVATDPDVDVVVNFTHEYSATGTYSWSVTFMDDVVHADSTWTKAPGTLTVEKAPTSTNWALIGGAVALLAIIALVAAFFLMKKKKKAGEQGGSGGMEGMAPPEPPPPAT